MEHALRESKPEKVAEFDQFDTFVSTLKTMRAGLRDVDQALRPIDLRATDAALLAAIRDIGPTTITRLADDQAMERTTVARRLKVLEADGLVNTEPGEDRRQRIVTLSETGLQTLAEAAQLLAGMRPHTTRDDPGTAMQVAQPVEQSPSPIQRADLL